MTLVADNSFLTRDEKKSVKTRIAQERYPGFNTVA